MSLILEKIKAQTQTNPNIPVFVEGNSKLGEGQVLIFNLPPVKTCAPTKWCIKHCYGMRGNHQFPTVIRSNENRYQLSLTKEFTDKALARLHGNSRYDKVRMHATGDFYSEEYINKWIEIATNTPKVRFLAFTKQVKFKDKLEELASLPNVNIFESLDESKKKPKTALKLASVELPLTNSYHCPGSCPACGFRCWDTEQNVVLHKH